MVNHLWYEVSVRILWTNIQNYNTLFVCLSNESKKILSKNSIIISTPISNSLLFNYVTFIKCLSVNKIDKIMENLDLLQPITIQSLNYLKYILAQEMYKMFMNQISSLKELEFFSTSQFSSIPCINVTFNYIPNIYFINYLRTIDCLKIF